MSRSKQIDLSRNQILAGLPKAATERLRPHLTPVSFKLRDVLCSPGERIEQIYFPFASVISSLIGLRGGEMVEVGMVGDEGVVGIEAILGAKKATNLAVVQVADGALKILPEALLGEFRRGGVLFDRIHRYINYFLAQVAQTAACNRIHTLEQRLSRWLLITRSRIKKDEFPMTHEFLASMLGAPRSEVTFAAGRLRNLGLIRYKPGHMTILEPQKLESSACECYQAVADLNDHY